MQEIVRSLSEHPLVAMAVCFAALLILYFFFKKLIKLALIIVIVAVAIGGYYYFREPGSKPVDLRGAVEKARIETGRAVEKGKEAVEKGRELFDRGKEAIEKGREMVDKGKAVLEAGIDKGKDASHEIGKILGREREAGKN